MKTKIIYISGNDIFDIADIRSAFEEVRNALSLAPDTVLFGVPVDTDDAGLSYHKNADSDHESVAIPAPETVAPITEKQKRKTKAKPKAEKETTTAEPLETSVAQKETTDEKIIPILSILSGKTEENPEAADQEPIAANDAETIKIESVAAQQVTINNDNPEKIITTQTIAVEDIAIDEEPESVMEKTLEQLLEEMAPLREDLHEESVVDTTASDPEDTKPFEAEESNIDATLEQLATEFATKQDEIATSPTAAPAGKIGKLKNILPFKKAKREESGLMGDLFGWAGIAANDEEFSIPGFFTTSASKK
ncbi:MAG: hypothetical protein LBF28_02795 [Rickettsiales bacterium]|jgi:hypothetical protein|nr:hypothetical protein [Rickettsiales bacterium]